jgi:endonuclease YncB( thermonuclease family)
VVKKESSASESSRLAGIRGPSKLGWVFATAIACQLAAAPVAAEELIGRATVIDADTVEIRGQRIRLSGVDAPESSQRCTRTDGAEWRCGQKAANALSEKIGHRNVRCVGDKSDRWKRLIAVCYLGKEDLGAWLVENGLAVAYRKYSKAYVDHEEMARCNKSGIWSSSFVMPWDWRRGVRESEELSAR